MRTRLALALAIGLIAGLAACGDSDSDPDEERPAEEPGQAGTATGGDRFPNVLAVSVEPTGGGAFAFSVTISSPYDSPERYADGWRILGPDGETIAEHELLHDHADEQPFTRGQAGVEVPPGIAEVVVEPRDSENGFGGGSRTVAVPGR